MSFHDVRFPDGISYGAQGGPEFQTRIVTTGSGFEKRNISWDQARGRWDVSHGIRTQDQLDELRDFFYARRGKAHSFRYKDWSDFEVTTDQFGLGDGTTVAFQLYKIYTSGGVSYNRPITKPVTGTVATFINGVPQSGGNYSVNYSTGVVTFTSAPASGTIIAWSGEFDNHARFDTDHFKPAIVNYNTYSWTEIPIIEIRDAV